MWIQSREVRGSTSVSGEEEKGQIPRRVKEASSRAEGGTLARPAQEQSSLASRFKCFSPTLRFPPAVNKFPLNQKARRHLKNEALAPLLPSLCCGTLKSNQCPSLGQTHRAADGPPHTASVSWLVRRYSIISREASSNRREGYAEQQGTVRSHITM